VIVIAADDDRAELRGDIVAGIEGFSESGEQDDDDDDDSSGAAASAFAASVQRFLPPGTEVQVPSGANDPESAPEPAPAPKSRRDDQAVYCVQVLADGTRIRHNCNTLLAAHQQGRRITSDRLRRVRQPAASTCM
jgi:hypothetical protein